MQKPRQNENARKLTYEISTAASLTCLIRIFSNMSKDALWSPTPFWRRSRLFMVDFMVWVCEARFTRLRVGRGVAGGSVTVNSGLLVEGSAVGETKEVVRCCVWKGGGEGDVGCRLEITVVGENGGCYVRKRGWVSFSFLFLSF